MKQPSTRAIPHRELAAGPIVWLGIILTTCLLLVLFQTMLWLVLPLLLAVVIATLVSRIIEPRSIYDARLTDEEIAQRQKLREPAKR